MLSNPRPGQRVRLHYANARRYFFVYYGRSGTVEIAGKGRPRNHLVRLDDGTRVIVPAGNLYPDSPTAPA
jgi:hypothetical protein